MTGFGFGFGYNFIPVNYSPNLARARITKFMSGPLGENLSVTTDHDVFLHRNTVSARGGFCATPIDAALRANQLGVAAYD